MHRSLVIALALFSLSVAYAGAVTLLGSTPAVPEDTREPSEVPVATVEGKRSAFWPYLSRFEGFEKRSPINVVVLGADAEQVGRLMRLTGWNRTPADELHANFSVEEFEGGTGIAWGEAEGATRYAYVHDGRDGSWVRERLQLSDGQYFGHRFHARLYDSPVPGEWVIVQVHSEHFDWFTLRHAVDGVAAGQRHVESDFLGRPFVRDVWRMHLANGGVSDGDGWATVIEIAAASAPLTAGAVAAAGNGRERVLPDLRSLFAAARRRVTLDVVLLAACIGGLVLAVRSGGVLLDHHVRELSAGAIIAVLFPILAVGVPLVTVAVARRIERRMDAAVTAAGALAVASLVDYLVLEIDVLPIAVLVHRVGLVFAIGLVAAGAARHASHARPLNGLVVTGSLAWTALVLAALVGLI